MAVGAGPRPVLAHTAGGARGLRDRPGGRVAVEAHHGVADPRADVDALPVGAERHPIRDFEPMAVGARPRPVLAHTAGGARGLRDRPGGRVADKARHGGAAVRGDVDAPPIRADRRRVRAVEPMAVSAGPLPRLADAAGAPGGLADRPGGRVAVEAHQAVADDRGDVDALPIGADRHPGRVGEPMAVSAGARPGLADAPGAPGWLADRPGGRIADKARDGGPAVQGDVDAPPVRADRHRKPVVEAMAVGARPRPVSLMQPAVPAGCVRSPVTASAPAVTTSSTDAARTYAITCRRASRSGTGVNHWPRRFALPWCPPASLLRFRFSAASWSRSP